MKSERTSKPLLPMVHTPSTRRRARAPSRVLGRDGEVRDVEPLVLRVERLDARALVEARDLHRVVGQRERAPGTLGDVLVRVGGGDLGVSAGRDHGLGYGAARS